MSTLTYSAAGHNGRTAHAARSDAARIAPARLGGGSTDDGNAEGGSTDDGNANGESKDGGNADGESKDGGSTDGREEGRGMARIFVVEDDAPIRNEVIEVLERQGYEASYCLTFDHVVEDILAARPDLVLLDLTLPGTDGQLICRELRQQSDIPVIVLTSRVTEVDEVMSMTMGADDFVSKPYSARVLVARVQALLRRTQGSQEAGRALEHNGVALDLSRSTATAVETGRSIELTKNEMRILSLLIGKAGTIVSREAIMRDLWDSDAFVDDNTLTVNINRLRATLEKIGVTGYLTTHRGRGYSV